MPSSLRSPLTKKIASIFNIISLTGAKGSADLNTEQEIELFDVLTPLEALEPGKLEQLYETYPSLKKAHDLFPEGQFSAGVGAMYSAGPGQKVNHTPDVDQQAALATQSVMLKQQVEALASTNLPAALDKADAIPLLSIMQRL